MCGWELSTLIFRLSFCLCVPWNATLRLWDNDIVQSTATGLSPLLESLLALCQKNSRRLYDRAWLIIIQINCVDFVLSFSCQDKFTWVSSQASFKKHWSRQMTRYNVVTLSTHCTLYRQQICAIFFIYCLSSRDNLELWPLVASWRDCDSAVMPNIIVALSLIVRVLLLSIIYLQSMHDNLVSHLYFLLSLLH